MCNILSSEKGVDIPLKDMRNEFINNQDGRNTKREFNSLMQSINGENWEDI